MKAAPFLSLACLAVLAACSTTTYKVFETRGTGIVEGRGGTKTIQDGMEIWDYGDPPRRFKVLGVIDDERPGGFIPMAQLMSDVVRKAREVGGHALIQVRSQAQIVGYQTLGTATATAYGGTAMATGTTTAVPFRRNYAQFVVVQYVE